MKFLVTGASSGIGEAIVKQLAKDRNDLIIIARREEKLNELKTELEKLYSINVEYIVADLTIEDDLKNVFNRIEQDDIDVLINNAGFGSSGPFVELDIDNELNEIDLNIKALVQLTHSAANSMAKNKSGTIVNISSIASYQPMVGNAVYGATKSFVTSFTHAISEELNSAGINVLLVCPGLTVSDFHKRSSWIEAGKDDSAYPKMLWKDSDEVAKMVVKSIKNHRSVLIPGILNKVIAFTSSSLPGNWTKKITAVVAKGRRTR
jgi:uncharacterized protein